jgi:hypothetical protein
MTCKNCGTQIADKALICYRCGQPTFEARRQPVVLASDRQSFIRRYLLSILVIVAIAVLGAVAWYAGWVSQYPWVAEVLGVVVVLYLVWRLWWRRKLLRDVRRTFKDSG